MKKGIRFERKMFLKTNDTAGVPYKIVGAPKYCLRMCWWGWLTDDSECVATLASEKSSKKTGTFSTRVTAHTASSAGQVAGAMPLLSLLLLLLATMMTFSDVNWVKSRQCAAKLSVSRYSLTRNNFW